MKKRTLTIVTGTADAELEARRAKAYIDMEPYLRDVAAMGAIASYLFDVPDRELYGFAVDHVHDMLDDLKKRYYALDFPA
jgi:hypothetical protein